MPIRMETLTGRAMLPHEDALARLRIRVFREWPYLYDGTLEYERGYLAHYAEQAAAVAVLAKDGETVVGAATGMPLSGAAEAFRAPFEGSSYSVADVYYFGESVLLPEYRGRGIGRRFMEEREEQARRCGARYAAFCAVMRDSDDPRRPPDHRPLEPFWRKRGFQPVPGLTARFGWREIGDSAESKHELGFWIKAL